MSLLTVNLDSVAMLKSTYNRPEPDPSQAAVLAELNGASGIAVQYRRDRKYLRDRDLYLLKGICKTRLVIETPPIEEALERIMEIKPDQVILVADHADSDNPVSTIEFNSASVDYGNIVASFSGIGIQAGFFVEPNTDDIKRAAKNSASAVLINCSAYVNARSPEDARVELDRLESAFHAAAKAGLYVMCGRGLDYHSIVPLVELGLVDNFIVGHAIVARALMLGLERAVKEMVEKINKS